MTVVYCNYALMDQAVEPDWVQLLLIAKEEELIEGLDIYRPFVPLADQSLKAFTEPSEERNEKLLTLQKLADLSQVFESWNRQPDKTRPNYQDILKVENLGREFSHTHVLKDLWVLSRCDIILTDCNTPDHGTKDTLHLLGKMLGLKTVGVCDRFLISPWSHILNDFTVNTPATLELLKMIVKTINKEEENQ